MRVSVTGATGFIGRRVVNELVSRNVEVVALVRDEKKSDFGPSVAVRCVDIKPDQKYHHDDIGAPDTLIHLAWGGLPNYRSLHHFEDELPAQYNFLSQLVKTGLGAVVGVGTCFEYGMQSGALSETLETQPDNCYGFAKDTLRRQLEMLKVQHPFAFSWARLFYLYGPDQNEKSLYPLLRQAVARGDKTFPMSQGEQLRDFLPVEVMVSHLVDLALARCDCGPVNICSGEPISVRGLVEKWLRDNNWSVELELGRYPYPDYEPMAFWGTRDKLERVLSLSKS